MPSRIGLPPGYIHAEEQQDSLPVVPEQVAALWTLYSLQEMSFSLKIQSVRPSGRYSSDECISLQVSGQWKLEQDSSFILIINGVHAATYTVTQGMRSFHLYVGTLVRGEYLMYGEMSAHFDENLAATVVWDEILVIVEEKVRVGPLPGRVGETFLQKCLGNSASMVQHQSKKSLVQKAVLAPEVLGIGEDTFAGKGDVDPCWWVLQKNTFGKPVFMTWQELAFWREELCAVKITDALRAKFPSRADVLGPHTRMGSCAVVGSAGHLRNSGLGQEIDRHDSILRINTATTLGYESDVGSRFVFSPHALFGSGTPTCFHLPLAASTRRDDTLLLPFSCSSLGLSVCIFRN